jgi:hypothetical protein
VTYSDGLVPVFRISSKSNSSKKAINIDVKNIALIHVRGISRAATRW